VIVVDTNVIAGLLLPSTESDAVGRLFRRDPRWLAPPLWRSEFRSVLVKQARAGMLDAGALPQLAQQAERLVLERPVATGDVLAAALATGCSPYDCEFAVLARGLGLPLATFDRRLLAAFPGLAVAPDAWRAD
jgi:predicted nucleic acid-binding protein